MQVTETAELVRQAQAGDQRAVTELYRRYYPRVVAFLKAGVGDPDLAEDLAQDTFMRALSALGRYDLGRGTKFVSWLFTIAKHLQVDRWRKQRGRGVEVAVGAGADLDLWACATRSAEASAIQREESTRLLAAIPREMAVAVALTQACGFTVAEAATRMGVPEGTVKSRTFNGLRHMARLSAAEA